MVVIKIDEDHKVTASITNGTITLDKLAADVKAKIDQAHTHENADELAKIQTGDKDKWDEAATQADANKAAIEAIKDGVDIDSFLGVEEALDDIEDEIDAAIEKITNGEEINDFKGVEEALDELDEKYDPAGVADEAKAAVIGEDSDEDSDNTIYGAKAYADKAVETALTWGSF